MIFFKECTFSNRPKGDPQVVPGPPQSSPWPSWAHLARSDSTETSRGRGRHLLCRPGHDAGAQLAAGPVQTPAAQLWFPYWITVVADDKSIDQVRHGSRPNCPRATPQVAPAIPRRLQRCQRYPGWPGAALSRSRDRLGIPLGRFEKVPSFKKPFI